MSIEEEVERLRKVVQLGAARAKAQAQTEANAFRQANTMPYANGQFERREDGVYFVELEGDSPTNERWLCAPLRVLSMVRSRLSTGWARLLEWNDADGTRHVWSMPMSLAVGDGNDIVRALCDLGLSINMTRRARELLLIYLTQWKTEERARCVDRLGWYDGVYVLPEMNIGEKPGERVVFQADAPVALHAILDTAGTCTDWRNEIAALARGNSRLVLALSAAFAGPLLDLVHESGAGFHLRGPSSCGKTTALFVAASVWGNPRHVLHTWRVTDNGLEGVAQLHNDRLLVLDELSQVDSHAAAQVAYLLANGCGKQRATRTGTARRTATWQLLFLSSGEQSLAAKLAEDRRRSSAGQELRLLDIPAEAGGGFGLFDTLNGMSSGADLADAIRERTATSYGVVARTYIERVAADRHGALERIESARRSFSEAWSQPNDSGQVGRALAKFSLVAAGGELATEYGLTGFSAGECVDGVGHCFDAWRAEFVVDGGKNYEQAEALLEVRAFIERHGASRFVDLGRDRDEQAKIPNRAGFTEATPGGRVWYFLPEVFRREVCGPFDYRLVIRVLTEERWLRRTSTRDATTKKIFPGLARTKVYAVLIPDEA